MRSAPRPKAYSYIRFSTPEQLKGDSLRRQKDLSRAFSEKHGLELDDSLNLSDLGVSAFRGKNRTTGALSGFFTAIDQGIVRPGSYLLVESLDRLSRSQITEALPAFLQIVNAGVKVVTLMDAMIYDKQSLDQNIGSLMMSLVVMSRAHEESATKSKRLASAWSAKRNNIQEKKLTALAPAWLELGPDRKSFKVIPERKKLVRRIFSMILQGHGKRYVAKQFNKEAIGTWGRGRRKGNGWHESYIQKILNNRAVLGEYQPCVMAGGKRVPEGPPIMDYFPRILDEETYQRVSRKPSGCTGPSGNIHNLFTKIAFDGYSGAAMHFSDKGSKKRGNGKWRYLVSDNSRLHPDAKRCSWAYSDIESLVIKNLVEIDWSKLAVEGDASELDEVNYQIADLESQLQLSELAIQRLVDAVETTKEPPAALVKRLSEQESQHEKTSDQLVEKKKLKTEIEQRGQLLQMSHIELKRAAEKLHDVAVRRKLREELRRKIKRMDLYPNGLEQTIDDGTHQLHLATGYKAVAITFVNGVVRWVVPSPGSTEVMCWHLVPTTEGQRFALQDMVNFSVRGRADQFRLPEEVKIKFSPIGSDVLISGQHKSVAGLALAGKALTTAGPVKVYPLSKETRAEFARLSKSSQGQNMS